MRVLRNYVRTLIFVIAGATLSPLMAWNVSGCRESAQKPDLASETEAIRALEASWVAAGQSKNVDAWIAFYADDAAVLPPNEPVAGSREAIRKSVSELLSLPSLSIDWKPTKIEIAQSGELAYLTEPIASLGTKVASVPPTKGRTSRFGRSSRMATGSVWLTRGILT
jgi:ketosteroid isomerase-like protein